MLLTTDCLQMLHLATIPEAHRRLHWRVNLLLWEEMNTEVVILLAATIANISLALFVLWHQPRAEVNRVFALTCTAVAGWAFTNALFQTTGSIAVATQAAAFSSLSAIVLGASFLHFAWIFPRRSAVPSSGKILLWSCAAVIGLMAFVPGVVIEAVDITRRSIATSWGYNAVASFMLLTTVLAFGQLLRQHDALRGIERAQSRYVLSGAALTAVIGLIFNLFFPLLGNYRYVGIGPIGSLFFASFSVYAIVAVHLFDIRIIIKRTLVYTLLLTAIGVGYTVTEHLLTEGLKQAAGEAQHPLLTSIGGAMVVSLFVAPLRERLEQWLDNLLFGRKSRRHRQPTSH